MHLEFIVGRVPTNGRATAGKWRASASHSVHPSLPFICLSSSLPTSSHVHTHELKPPDRKYRLGSQRGFLIQTSPVEQPEVASPTPLPLFLFNFCSLSASVGFNHLPPHVLATRAHTQRHTSMIQECTPTIF